MAVFLGKQGKQSYSYVFWMKNVYKVKIKSVEGCGICQPCLAYDIKPAIRVKN